jgi:hypothetical protein
LLNGKKDSFKAKRKEPSDDSVYGVKMAEEIQRPWMVYKKKDGSVDKLYQPGWAGELDQSELERLQQALMNDPDLARVWGWRPSMKRRAAVAVERVAYWGSPNDIALNRRLVREAGRRPKEDDETPSACVKKVRAPVTPRLGRHRVESWESEMLRLAASGLGLHKIARELKTRFGIAISGPTVSARLKELQGQLRLIS